MAKSSSCESSLWSFCTILSEFYICMYDICGIPTYCQSIIGVEVFDVYCILLQIYYYYFYEYLSNRSI